MASEFLTVDEVIAEASSVIKNFTEQEKQIARQWAYSGLRQIGFGKLDIKVSDPIYLSDWSATKPTDLANTIDLSLFNSGGDEQPIRFKGRASDETTDGLLFPRVHQDRRGMYGYVFVTEDDTYFNVEEYNDSNPTSAYIVVKYYAYPVDSNGLPRIPETHRFAIMMYIRYQWAMRERRSLGEVQEARQTWLMEKARTYGEMKTPSMLEGKEIARGLNSMIQKVTLRNRQF